MSSESSPSRVVIMSSHSLLCRCTWWWLWLVKMKNPPHEVSSNFKVRKYHVTLVPKSTFLKFFLLNSKSPNSSPKRVHYHIASNSPHQLNEDGWGSMDGFDVRLQPARYVLLLFLLKIYTILNDFFTRLRVRT